MFYLSKASNTFLEVWGPFLVGWRPAYTISCYNKKEKNPKFTITLKYTFVLLVTSEVGELRRKRHRFSSEKL